MLSILYKNGPLELGRPLVIGQELLTSISRLFLVKMNTKVLPLNICSVQLPIFVMGEAIKLHILHFTIRWNHRTGYSGTHGLASQSSSAALA